MRPLGVLLLSLVCFLAAQGTGIRLFFHLFYLLLALLILSLIWAWSNLRGLAVQRESLTQRTHVGDYARERLTLRNRWPFPKLWVEVRDHSDLPNHGAGFVTYLGSYQHSRWLARTLCTMRGKFTLGPATLISGDPFGIFRLERRLDTTSEIIVYPQIIDLPNFNLPDAELPGGQDVRSRTYNVTPNVATVREYMPGDSFNRIHWRSTARSGQLMVKEFELDPTADIYLVLDMQERTVVKDLRAPSNPTPAAKRPPFWMQPLEDQRQTAPARSTESTEEYCVVATASIARRLLSQNRFVGLVAWGQHREVIPAERESRQLFKILEALAMLRAHGAQPLAEVLIAEGQRFGRNSTLVIITASVDERWPIALQQLLYRGVRAIVIFIDPQSFGGWRDPALIIGQLAEMRIPVYRWTQGQALTDALRQAVTLGAMQRSA